MPFSGLIPHRRLQVGSSNAREGARWVEEFAKIAKHYLAGWFTIDLISILPFQARKFASRVAHVVTVALASVLALALVMSMAIAIDMALALAVLWLSLSLSLCLSRPARRILARALRAERPVVRIELTRALALFVLFSLFFAALPSCSHLCPALR